ncbi:MAG: GGDEF domain-containing protein [Armatimonadota bacterium]
MSETTVTGRDHLSNLGNSEELFEALSAEITNAAESDGSVSIALIDIDNFGQINDNYGHEVGDKALELVAGRLIELTPAEKRVFRHSFRAGGDEFVIVMPSVEKEDAFLLLERERAAFAGEHEIEHDGQKLAVPITFSAAVATFPEDGLRPQDVLRKANDALYRAKTTGRNKVCLAKEERMVTKTSHYTQAQLARLAHLAKREKVGEAVLLREALDDLLMQYGM